MIRGSRTWADEAVRLLNRIVTGRRRSSLFRAKSRRGAAAADGNGSRFGQQTEEDAFRPQNSTIDAPVGTQDHLHIQRALRPSERAVSDQERTRKGRKRHEQHKLFPERQVFSPLCCSVPSFPRVGRRGESAAAPPRAAPCLGGSHMPCLSYIYICMSPGFGTTIGHEVQVLSIFKPSHFRSHAGSSYAEFRRRTAVHEVQVQLIHDVVIRSHVMYAISCRLHLIMLAC